MNAASTCGVALILALALIAAACTPAPALTPSEGVPPDQPAAPEAAYGGPTAVGYPETSLGAPTAAASAAGEDAASWVAATVGNADFVLVDDWWAAIDGGQPESQVIANLGMGGNAMQLLPSALARPQQRWSIDLTYGITEAAPHDFVGFDRDLAETQDWGGAERVLLDVDLSRASDVSVVFQFRETSGEVWRFSAPPGSVPPGEPLTIPLDGDHFARADWSTQVNDAIDLGAIDRYGFYVGHTGPDHAGTVTLGAIAAYRP